MPQLLDNPPEAITAEVTSGSKLILVPRSDASGTPLAGRIPELDGLRGLAIALVIVYHYVNVTLPARTALYYALLPIHLMFGGVDLFFVLSGFLIGGILLDHRDSPQYYRTFYARRVSRILPLYYALIGTMAAGHWIWPHFPLFASKPIWVYLLFGQNLTGDFLRASIWMGVTWSLAVEEQFYLIFPAIVRVCSKKRLLLLMGAYFLAAPFLRVALLHHGWGFEKIYPSLPCRADALAAGVIAAIFARSERARGWIRQNCRPLMWCLIVATMALATVLKWATLRYLASVGFSIIALCSFLLLILVVIAPMPRLRMCFRTRWLCHLGRISYCVYLVHVPVLVSVFYLFGLGIHPEITGWKTFLVVLLSLIVTITLAQLSWKLLEKRLIRRAQDTYLY